LLTARARPPARRPRDVNTTAGHLRPLVVDPAGELGEEALRRLQRAFDERRAAGHAPALFIATPRDPDSSHWCVRARARACACGGGGDL